MPSTPRLRSCLFGGGGPIYPRLGFAILLPRGLIGGGAETGDCVVKEMSGNHDALVVEAGAALPLDGGVECYGGYRSVPEDGSPLRNGLKKEIEKIK